MFSLFNRKAEKQRKKKHKSLSDFYDVLSHADKTYANMPLRMQLEIEKVSQGLPENGPRKLKRAGPGSEFFEARDFRPGIDERRHINARLTARYGRPMVIDKEAEIRQHFFLWRDSSPSMEYNSGNSPYTKKQAAEIMLLALAKHLAKNEEMIGILDKKGLYRGGKASDLLAEHLAEVNILSADMPFVERKLPKHSTAVLFSDFMTDPETIREGLSHLQGIDLKGMLVVVLDPQEIEFNYKGHVEFEGSEGEGEIKFEKAESMKDAFQGALENHLATLQKIAEEKRFEVIVQRTDRPLHEALYRIYGLEQPLSFNDLKNPKP
jgi:uncharacterized protein (DUF58 family)